MGEADFQIGTARRTEISGKQKPVTRIFGAPVILFSLSLRQAFHPASRGVGWKYVYRLLTIDNFPAPNAAGHVSFTEEDCLGL